MTAHSPEVPQTTDFNPDDKTLYVSAETYGGTPVFKDAPEGFQDVDPATVPVPTISSEWDAHVFGKDTSYYEELLKLAPGSILVQRYHEDGTMVEGQSKAMQPVPIEAVEPVPATMKARLKRALGFKSLES